MLSEFQPKPRLVLDSTKSKVVDDETKMKWIKEMINMHLRTFRIENPDIFQCSSTFHIRSGDTRIEVKLVYYPGTGLNIHVTELKPLYEYRYNPEDFGVEHTNV